MSRDSVIVLGAANLRRRDRTLKSGAVKSRYTVQVSGDSILINTDPKTLGKGPAEAIGEFLRKKITGISASAAASTIAGRARARKAFDEGKSWALKRYGGGRMGPMQPHQTDRLFNDSGRMAKSIAVGPNDKDWVVNVAANRFDPNTLNGSAGALTRIFNRLLEFVPELGNAQLLVNSKEVVAALKQGISDAIDVVDERNVELRRQRMQAGINLARQILSLVA